MPTDDFRAATVPLFADSLVDVVEGGPDVRYACGQPPWFTSLLDVYSEAGRLYAHGVHYSTLTAEDLPHHEQWLQVARDAARERSPCHFSEHFGFMVAGAFDRGAPMPMPMTEEVGAIGLRRLRALRDAVGVPVGLENLAFAFSRRDALNQGEFLDALLDPVDGFVLLDLHNLWCQAVNFDIAPSALLDSYPLERVTELHLSGGSWTDLPQGGRFRRDTHDDALPEALFPILEEALSRCPRVALVIVERMGGTLPDHDAQRRLSADYRRVREVVGA